MTINNQCSCIELTSPMYFIKDATCHIHLPQQVNSKGKMKVDFITGVNRDTFGGVLLYHLQRKESDESNDRSDIDGVSIKDTSTSSQLLVIWGRKSDCLYSHVYIVEHENTLVWNEDKLERLYHIYDSQYKAYFILVQEEWLLDGKTMLKTVCKSSHGGFKMDVIISEDKYSFSPIKPLWVDSNR
jgi:hypothetical protein